MDKRAISLLQQILGNHGYYAGRIDGIRGDATDAGIVAMIAARSADIDGTPEQWSLARKAIACLQLGCRDADLAVGPIDGLWGPQTDNAVDELEETLTTGRPPAMWRDAAPVAR